jgi:hypothetical protein
VEDIVMGYTGAKRARYESAAASLLVEPITKRDANVTAFVKCEKRKRSDKKDPRIIQMRSPRYNLCLAQYLKKMEKSLLGYKGNTRVPHRTRVIAKGLTTWEHARLIVTKWAQFGDPVCLSIDAARFDKHVSKRLLELEHMVWRTMNPDPMLARLLSWQLVNKGRSMHGIKYRVVGNRMSGDYNTGSGNCVLMSGMLETALSQYSKWDYLCNSDDALIFVERADMEAVMGTLSGSFLSFGHEVVCEEPAFELTEIVHCQQKLVEVEGRWRMVRDYRKVLSQAFAGPKHFHEARGGMRVVKSIAQCELTLTCGVPVLQALFQRVLDLTSHLKFAALDTRDTVTYLALQERGQAWAQTVSRPITARARETFEQAFGLDASMQRAIEDKLSKLELADIDLSALLGPHQDPRCLLIDADLPAEVLDY